ncbi:hypothetical protein CLAFUW4_01182 [Fulvia fulva]|uniref:DUF7729 domain-containing protein n=1 Tax=Passalora fulva TaxID=5499 RepID=A0A9Q8L7L9_PASFU|nr:uncharacterized protein CLAFUR5_01187 [Fulvia fulva]KAK4635247.1 hypothetical protein CLAFUR4_01183 [Fulvia fulva]KAK4637392.1 hypothetical protein CLAFUR0_01184 [Fulvia fulva]UJO12266.1 hypothetical protein CLAFUR5_01187 [Fulvia fulva]WPV10264.1 hypothetical protein CLAFUW4_01182 [Fulvia fulva]WPV24621.1 hypothetical protein CLAFUW7_01187 [Fulvia fulva]
MTTAISSCSSTRTARAAVQPWLCYRQRWNEPTSSLCHTRRPPPARTISKQIDGSISRASNLALVFLLCLLAFCQGAKADVLYGFGDISPPELLFDRSEPPPLPRMLLEPRQDDSLSSLPSTTTRPTGSSTPTTPGSGIQTASETASFDLPRPFDTSIGNNFTTTTCPTFFQNFLSNQTLRDCLPFSLLLQTSNSFFTASRSPLRLAQTLNATCSVDFNTCSTLMSQYAQQIQQNSHCGADLEMQNPMVTQAYNGFVSYPTLYHAGCLTDTDGNYCFSNAVTNTSSPSSSYIYYLPLGVKLPGGARPACNTCLQNTMAIFAETAGNASQPLSQDYGTAAEQVQMICGPQFVDSSIMTSAATTSLPPHTPSMGLAGVAISLALLWNLL